MKNYFENCRTLDELKAEYKRLAKQYHPDMGGDTRPVKEELKAAGMRWASKKRMWYWHSGEYYKRSSNASMDAIRRKYGSRIVTKREGDLAYA